MPISFSTTGAISYAWIQIGCIFFLLLKDHSAYGRRFQFHQMGTADRQSPGLVLRGSPALAVMIYVLLINFLFIHWLSRVMVGLYCLHYFNQVSSSPFDCTRGRKCRC